MQQSRPPAAVPLHPQPVVGLLWRPTFEAGVASAFRHETGDHGWGNNEIQNYTASPENSFIGPQPEGALVLKAIASHDGRSFTSARLVSYQKMAWPRGHVAARISAPLAKGIWPAFWLLPVENLRWPDDGEVDILETWGGRSENGACLHWGHFTPQDGHKHRMTKTPIARMELPHTYGFSWEGRRCVWFIDGRPTMRAVLPDTCRPFSEYNIILNIAMGGNVMNGERPDPGEYFMVVHSLGVWDAPNFEGAWALATEGRTM